MTQGVPATLDDLVQQYERFVIWSILRISRRKVRPEDIPDLVQMVYLRVWQKDYLTRCRQLIEERGTGEFSTYLYLLVRTVCCNYFAYNRRHSLSLATATLLDPREAMQTEHAPRRRGRALNPERSAALRPYFVDTEFEQRLETEDALHRLEQYLETTKRGARLSRTLQLLYEGYSPPEIAAATGLNRSQVVKARKDVRKASTRFLKAG